MWDQIEVHNDMLILYSFIQNNWPQANGQACFCRFDGKFFPLFTIFGEAWILRLDTFLAAYKPFSDMPEFSGASCEDKGQENVQIFPNLWTYLGLKCILKESTDDIST